MKNKKECSPAYVYKRPLGNTAALLTIKMVYIQETDYNIKSKSLFFHLPCVPCCVYITPLFFFSNYTSPRSNKSSIEAQSSGQQKTSWRTGKKATAGASSSFNFYEAIICFPHFQDAVMYLLINGNVQITGKFKIAARYLIHKNFDPVELVETTWFFFYYYYCYTDLIMVINWSFLFNAQFFSMTPWWACFWQLEIKGRCSSSLVFALSLLPDVLAAQHQYVSLNNGYR